MKEVITKELAAYLQRLIRIELRAMYTLDIDDEAFGVETDLYSLFTKTLNGVISTSACYVHLATYYAEDANIQEIAERINSMRRYDI